MLGYVMHAWRKLGAFATIGIVTVSLTVLAGCAAQEAEQPESGQAAQAEATVEVDDVVTEAVSDVPADNAESSSVNQAESAEAKASSSADVEKRADAEALRAQLGIVEDYRAEFSHGPKGADYQRYIMLHDTESDADPLTIVDYWDGADIARLAAWARDAIPSGGHLLLVHWTGDTDYPKSGDDAVAELRSGLGDAVEVVREERRERYRLDLWRRR